MKIIPFNSLKPESNKAANHFSFAIILFIFFSLLAPGFFKVEKITRLEAIPQESDDTAYRDLYIHRLEILEDSLSSILQLLESGEAWDKTSMMHQVERNRILLKSADFWLRYVDPIQYRKLNGVLPVEWEVEVFEKWEPPYRREGGGLFLAEESLSDEPSDPEALKGFFRNSLYALNAYKQDSNMRQLNDPGHFYFANRLFLQNLAVIYTSGFECPDTSRICSELLFLLHHTREIYAAYTKSYPPMGLSTDYMNLYFKMIFFVNSHQKSYSDFDHFVFIRDYVNPLHTLNAKRILELNLRSKSFQDYALNNRAESIFSKDLYRAQESLSLFKRAPAPVIRDLKILGEQLFHDPILSGNNMRSCASCHKPDHFFTDTLVATAMRFDQKGLISRNAPTLVNATTNHLVMFDGAHLSLKDQLKAVHQKVDEMNADEKTTMQELLSCPDYKKQLQLLVDKSSEETMSFDHVAEAIIAYYTSFDTARSAFDLAMNGQKEMSSAAIKGFNLFMGKAKCATCHFAPHFNGIKPPYTGNEFEILGTPVDTAFTKISPDFGRYTVHPVPEMKNAFRTGTLRNVERTRPYMHNGVYNSLEEVIEFYDKGGARGRGHLFEHQTLSAEHLNLTALEKSQLIQFLKSLNEHVSLPVVKPKLPECRSQILNQRIPGGVY